MPELWIPSGGANRKIKELYIPNSGINRKIKEAYTVSGGANRKIFSGGIEYSMSVSHSTSSDWAGSTFSLADNASGRMHANVIYPYSTNAVFNLFIDFKEPILKSNLTGNALLWLDFVYDKLKVTNRGAAAYLVFNGNTNAMAGNKTLFLGTDADSGSGRISFNFADMNTTAAALTYISQIRLVLYAEIVTSNKTDGYIDVSFGAGDIYLFNKWIYLKNDYIQV